jgi:hypothetical protein
MTGPTVRCVECRRPGRAPRRRCPDCRAPVHARCQANHACAAKRARVRALGAEAEARLVRYRVVLILQVDSARGAPQTWDWLGLHSPEQVVAEVTRADPAGGEPEGPDARHG